ncbi:MAG: RagB/SusD family nutrient uptake outer membrane protein [Chitinophaga sp.]|uniref:RagB/SusD family nutrient uptake outer membrane protein n=1 Tax=Chitinophaga sp. TaxID=1869181 RepID=UPI001B2292A6|nr:RagB/SusD family nutrient uptake outer membrane protein [Chitinophaga sp.]MBO9727322.1 RagB/SusD family nutrient uptake outer membrane protein [Chitinophaga sp.]
MKTAFNTRYPFSTRTSIRIIYQSGIRKNLLLKPIIFVLIISLCACKKLVSIDPPITSTNGINVYNSDATASAVLIGIYTKMTSGLRGGGLTSLTLFPGLSADELILFGGANSGARQYIPYYQNRLTRSTTGAMDFTYNIYPILYITNAAIEGISSSTSLTPKVKKQLLGEAKFMRAFCNFYLTNLYGDIPLAITTDYTINAVLARSSQQKVYQQIVSDLEDAQALLTDNYIAGNSTSITTERVRPNKWAATALLARTYLFMGDWVNAEKQSTLVISNSVQYNLDSLNNAFLRNSMETIWSLQPTLDPTAIPNTEDANLFILPSTGPTLAMNYPVYLSNNVINSFEKGDQRKNNWIDSVVVKADNTTSNTYYYAYKYKLSEGNIAVNEYTIVLRLAEQYLIRSEARAQQSNTSGAADDLNLIRKRAGLSKTTANSKETLLDAILHERQVELFTEWGHRWFDLKRTHKIDEVMSIVTPQKGGTWNNNWQLYPFRDLELASDPNLVQNPGY